ncbi:MAG: cobalt-factor II C(20)-methyltransferase [Methanotrichaceae archaeon]
MLVGVSLGPGDPELLTYKAVNALEKAEKVFVPGEMATDLVRPYAEPELLEFPMISNKKQLEKIWAENADKVANYAMKGLTVFACIGDVNTFSTFSHLKRVIKERHPQVETKTIPGVGTIPALAAKFEIDLSRSFYVTDGSSADTVIRMKAAKPAKIAADLKEEGFDEFILGVRLYTSQEQIVREDMPEESDYFSVLYARKNKQGD